MSEINKEALEHAATFAFELLSNDGWEPGELSAEVITKEILHSYLEKKCEIDREHEGDEEIVTSYIHPPIPNRNFDWCAYRKGDEESGRYGWGATAQEAINNLEEA